jgi:hypothetical protein
MDVFFETIIEGSTQTDKIFLKTTSNMEESIEFIKGDMEEFCNKNSLIIPTIQSNKTYAYWGRTFNIVWEVGSFRWSMVQTNA